MNKYMLCSLFSAAVIFLTNCSEDKGNYDYDAIDDVTITLPASYYNVVSGGRLKITPVLTHLLEEKKGELSYLWEVDGTAISTDLNLDVLLPAMSYGSKVCALTVTDNTTGMKFIKTFSLEVVGEISVGYYFLTEDDSQNTIMSYLPIATEENPDPEIIQTKACGGALFSASPISITGIFGASNIAGSGIWSIIILSKGEGNRCVVTEGKTFLPTTIVSETNFVDQNMGYTFNPESCINSMQGELYFISNGQFILYKRGLLYRPAKHEADYYWSYPMASCMGYSFFYVYDTLSHRYYAIKPLVTNPELGIVGDSNAYDDVVEIGDSPDLSGHTIIGAFSLLRKANLLCTATTEGLHLHTFSNVGTTSFQYEGETMLPVSGAGADTKAVVVKNLDWYFFVGNRIYTSPIDMPKLADYATIPDEYGRVTSVSVSGKQSRLVVTTYNEKSNSELKGSILFINIETKEIKAYKNVIHKCVSSLSANDATSDWYDIGGDGL